MLKDGTYAAWFKTPLGQGTGIAHVADGKIWGRDSIMSYSGSCEVDGDRFTAVVALERHTEGHPTVFGTDDLTLKLEGTCPGKIARFVATAEQVPGVLLEGTLILSEEQPAASTPSAPSPTFNPDRLPKLPTALPLIGPDCTDSPAAIPLLNTDTRPLPRGGSDCRSEHCRRALAYQSRSADTPHLGGAQYRSRSPRSDQISEVRGAQDHKLGFELRVALLSIRKMVAATKASPAAETAQVAIGTLERRRNGITGDMTMNV